MADFSTFADSLNGPARSLRTVTPDDDNDLPDGVCKGLFIVTDGNLQVVAMNDADDEDVTIAVTAGMTVPVMARRVMEDTTATVVALY
jgi:hypothetical protein